MRVDETSAGKSISAFVILDSSGAVVGKILAHYGKSGRVSVNVWDWTDRTDTKYREGSAGGYGYDKLTAALGGIPFGQTWFYDHCEKDDASVTAFAEYMTRNDRLQYDSDGLRAFFDKWHALGVSFANWQTETGYTSAYMVAGIRGLEARGYTVFQAI